MHKKRKNMRTFVILLLIISIKSFGQSPINFVDSNATWNVAETFPNGNIQNPNFVATVTKVYGLQGDTLVGSVLWTKIFSTSDSIFFSNLTFSGKLREENNVVFFMDTTNIIDTLYNFNLQIGDSFAYNFGFGNNYLFVTNIDSFIISGNYHKRFYFSEPTGMTAFTILQEIWLEGIGSIHGPLFPAKPTVFSTEIPDSLFLTCYKINDSTIWNNPNYNDCYINIVLSSTDFQEKNGNIFTFPNPVTNKLIIELPLDFKESFVISVFNIEGKLIKKQICNNGGQFIMDTKSLNKNIYILQVENGGIAYRTKFTKQ